jgi:hypothetical protein
MALWVKRALALSFLFFLVKGLVWIGIAIVAVILAV